MKDILDTKQRATFKIDDLAAFKAQLLAWAKKFDRLCFLDSGNIATTPLYASQDFLLAAGAHSEICCSTYERNAFDQLRDFQQQCQDWIFGFLTYDLKNEVEKLTSKNADGLHFPQVHFFQAEYLIQLKGNQVLIESHREEPEAIWAHIQKAIPLASPKIGLPDISIQSRFSKSEYLTTVQKIREHIIEGDLYEMNFCQEFFAEDCDLDPLEMFVQLNQIAKAPFSAYYRMGDHYLLCASPERFLKKEGRKVISQPIKGTISREAEPQLDRAHRDSLLHSEKDRAENVMIVDLVRNDLARSCQAGSVEVEELFGIYSFEQVHQMISTVSGQLREDIDLVEAIRNAFPMGSMTGAPKVMSMELIEHYERSRRGLYSGALGYITPEGDFDFNVVIRSILYNSARSYLSFQVGGAIVYDSVPELEYEECLLKAKVMLQVLGAQISDLS